MNIDAAKYRLIQFITEIQSEYVIQKLLAFVNQFRNKPELEQDEEEETEDLLAVARIPTPDFIPLKELKKQQGYSIEKLRATYATIDHSVFADEDLDELLALT